MTTTTKPVVEVAAYWRDARKLYTVYSSLLERFAVGMSPSRELESPIDRHEPEAVQNVQRWFAQMDDRVHVHQLRQLLQTSRLGTEDNLRVLVSHHLQKETKTDGDRDKVDFLLVQYLSSCAPPGFYERDVEFDEVAQVLEPILGEVGLHPPKWLEPLNESAKRLDGLNSLGELLNEGILEQMRQLKTSAGEMYFGPTALVAIARVNFMVRKTFVRLIAADLQAIRTSLNELERRGISTVDCVRAGLGPQETLEALRHVCQEWKKPFRAAYTAGQNFKELIEIRGAVEEALAPASRKSAIATEAGGNGVPKSSVQQPSSSPVRPVTGSFASPSVSPRLTPTPVPTPAPVTSGGPAQERRPETALPQAEKSTVLKVPETRVPSAEKPAALQKPVLTPERPIPAPTPIPVITTPTPIAIADLQAIQQKIPQELAGNGIKAGSMASITLGNLKLALSTWEVNAFLKGGDETSETLQRSVSARGFLASQIDLRKRGGPMNDLRSAVHVAKYESAKIQARLSVAKQANDIDNAVNLAATSKRLQVLIEEADKLAK